MNDNSDSEENNVEPTEKKSWADESNNSVDEVNMKNMQITEEELFSREKAIANEDKKVSECNEAELLEILWKRGNDNLNIALRKGVEKLYRMLRGDRIHPPQRHDNRRNKPYRGRRRYKKNDHPRREFHDEPHV